MKLGWKVASRPFPRSDYGSGKAVRNRTLPHYAYFGQKDAAQVAVLRKMARDLDMDVEIVVCPTIREADGLAMSSRNVCLSPDERQQALCLRRALCRVQRLAAAGEHDAGKLIGAARQVIAQEPAVRIDYLEIVDPETLESLPDLTRGGLAAVACFVGYLADLIVAG